MKAGRLGARRRLIIAGMLSAGAALTTASLAFACTVPVGFTWYSDGTAQKQGPSGTIITAYATGAKANTTFELVTGNNDGEPGHEDHACMFNITRINPNLRLSSPTGVIPNTGGRVTAAPGVWQVCFREVPGGSTATIPVSFTVL